MVIVVGSDGDKIKEAVGRSQVVGKLTIEFLEDTSDPAKRFHAKSILRARCLVLLFPTPGGFSSISECFVPHDRS